MDSPEDRLLSQDEVDQLPEGTAIIVTWSGGNGPHRYVVTILGRQRYAGDLRNDNPLRFVGRELYHTHVSLAPVAPEAR